MLKKIFINILILFLLILVAEFIAFSILVCTYKKVLFYSIRDLGISLKTIEPFSEKNYDKHYRIPLISDKKEGGIIIFGCSFGFGNGLNDEQNLSGKLFKLTNLNVYNRSEGGLGTQMMLYQLETEDILKVTNNCKYIIYVFIDDHQNRNLKYRCWPFLNRVTVRYNLDKNNQLKLEKIPFLFMYSNIYKLYENSLPFILGEEYRKNLFYKMIEKSYRKSKQLYPNSKFIILNYSRQNIPLEKDIKKLGINVISIKDLTLENVFSVKYQITAYDTHPNEKAWDLLSPLLIEKAAIK